MREGGIGRTQQRLLGLDVGRRIHGHPHRHRHAGSRPPRFAQEDPSPYVAPNSLRYGDGTSQVGGRKSHEEFLAAVTRDDVHFANASANALGHAAEDRVAERLAP